MGCEAWNLLQSGGRNEELRCRVHRPGASVRYGCAGKFWVELGWGEQDGALAGLREGVLVGALLGSPLPSSPAQLLAFSSLISPKAFVLLCGWARLASSLLTSSDSPLTTSSTPFLRRRTRAWRGKERVHRACVCARWHRILAQSRIACLDPTSAPPSFPASSRAASKAQLPVRSSAR